MNERLKISRCFAVAPLDDGLAAVGGRADQPRPGTGEEAFVGLRGKLAETGVEVVGVHIDPQAAVLQRQLLVRSSSWRSPRLPPANPA